MVPKGDAMRKEMVRIAAYPQLMLLAWQRQGKEIAADEAFALYEANWRFVDEETLTGPERKLIERLARVYGKGVLNV